MAITGFLVTGRFAVGRKQRPRERKKGLPGPGSLGSWLVVATFAVADIQAGGGSPRPRLRAQGFSTDSKRFLERNRANKASAARALEGGRGKTGGTPQKGRRRPKVVLNARSLRAAQARLVGDWGPALLGRPPTGPRRLSRELAGTKNAPWCACGLDFACPAKP